MRLLPLKLVAISLILFEFANITYLVNEEHVFSPDLFEWSVVRFGLYLQCLLHTANFISGFLIWFRRRIGVIIFIVASLLNFTVLEYVSYSEAGRFGAPGVWVWPPFVLVSCMGLIYWRTFKRP